MRRGGEGESWAGLVVYAGHRGEHRRWEGRTAAFASRMGEDKFDFGEQRRNRFSRLASHCTLFYWCRSQLIFANSIVFCERK